jgi:ADP-ribose pyrophosphatase
MANLTPPLFVYGTLRDAEVFRFVTGLALSSVGPVPALAPQHLALTVQGAVYPVLVRQDGEAAQGLLLSALPIDAIAVLDHFEGDGYSRASITVMVDGVLTSAQVYVGSRPVVTEGPWTLEAWERNGKAAFLAAIAATRQAPEPEA